MLSQLLVNALISASVYSLIGAGVSLAYSGTRVFPFAHAAIFTCGAYAAYVFQIRVGAPVIMSSLFAALVGGALGLLLDLTVYRPLRRKSAGPLVLLLSSIGVYLVLQNVISLIFGDASRSIRPTIVEEGIPILGARITSAQIVIIIAAIALYGVLMVWLTASRRGRILRAVISDPCLAELSGINVECVVLSTTFIASALAATGGVLQSLDVDMTPTVGMPALLSGVVAAVVGGMGSPAAAAFGALFLAMAQQLTMWRIGTAWQDVTAFVILLVFIILRPQGFFGTPVRKGVL